MALASFGMFALTLLCIMSLTHCDAGVGSAASVFMVKEQNVSPTGLTEANVKWHFLAFFISGKIVTYVLSHSI